MRPGGRPQRVSWCTRCDRRRHGERTVGGGAVRRMRQDATGLPMPLNTMTQCATVRAWKDGYVHQCATAGASLPATPART